MEGDGLSNEQRVGRPRTEQGPGDLRNQKPLVDAYVVEGKMEREGLISNKSAQERA